MKFYSHIALVFLFVIAVAGTSAQEPEPNDLSKPAADAPTPGERRPNLMLELGLSPEQVKQMREINRQRRPKMEAAQITLREANRALDNAIYSDRVNEEEVTQKLGDYQAAQSSVAKLRADSELSVRKILTPEQLVKFREIRRRFAESRGRRLQPGPGMRRFLRQRQMQRPN